MPEITVTNTSHVAELRDNIVAQELMGARASEASLLIAVWTLVLSFVAVRVYQRDTERVSVTVTPTRALR
jgi:hypothetical protein